MKLNLVKVAQTCDCAAYSINSHNISLPSSGRFTHDLDAEHVFQLAPNAAPVFQTCNIGSCADPFVPTNECSLKVKIIYPFTASLTV